MTIHELLQAAGLTANDEIPIWDVDGTGEPTKKITAQQLAAAVVALANLVTGVKGDKESDYRTGNVNLTPANIGAAVNTALTNQDLNAVTTPGFYSAGGGNTITNKPNGVDAFGLAVIHSASGSYHTQILYPLASAVAWKRSNNKGTWSAWSLEVSGVKGSAESSYRTGNVNLTPANIGLGVNVITDWNDFLPDNTSGVHWHYCRVYNGNAANAPISGNNITYFGWVMGGPTYCIQCAYVVYADTASNRGRNFTRCRVNSVWEAWIEIGAVTGVKGNTESSYRTGNINITPANIGAVNESGDTMTGPLAVPTFSSIFGTSAADPILLLRRDSGAGANIGAIFCSTKLFNDKKICNRLYFRHYSHDSSGDSVLGWEQYALPVFSGNGTDKVTYDILTSKAPVTIPQGGTNATTAAGARANLAVAQRIQMYSANYSTWADVYAALAALDKYVVGVIYIDSAVSTLVTDGKVTGYVLTGTVSNYGSGFWLMLRNTSGSMIYNVWITNASATGRTTTVYKFTGTVI